MAKKKEENVEETKIEEKTKTKEINKKENKKAEAKETDKKESKKAEAKETDKKAPRPRWKGAEA